MRHVVGAIVLFTALACGAPPPPPAEAEQPIPLDGRHVKLDAVDSHKFLQYAVGTSISAPPATVWELLTDAPGYPRWNSTVVSIDGTIAKDQRIGLTAKVAPDRVFELDVSEFDPPRRMVWSDGDDWFKGVRTFTLTERADGGTDFTMKEAFSGRMLPMIASQLPDFGPDFEGFAADLKREAETH